METAWHRKNLQERLKKLDALIDEQMASLEALEATEGSYALPQPFQDAAVRREKIRKSLAELEAADRAHLHPKEPEATVVKTRTHQPLGYNGQAVVDEKSDLIVAQTVVTDEQDRHQLVPMVEAVKETVGRVAEETVADRGYHNGEQIAEAERKQLPVLVGLQAESSGKGELSKSHFRYDAERDGYVCPRGVFLPLAFIRKPTTGNPHPVAVYRCHDRDCPIRSQCTSDPKGRSIKRLPFEEAVERQAAKQRMPEKKERMERRKAIVEHIFGLMKQHHGFRRFTVRGLDGVRAQFALLCSVLNLWKLYAHWRTGRLALAA
jgi:transposase